MTAEGDRPGPGSSVVWHDLECGGYGADLSVWAALADGAEDPVLDLGCGTGRVSLHLARRGHRVLGLDVEPRFVAALGDRAGQLPAEARVGDAREFELELEFGLVLGPMQLVQLFRDATERSRCLRCVARGLRDGGLAAFAIVEATPSPADAAAPIPDAGEIDGWIYSSLPIDAGVERGAIAVRRLRQTVSPEGALSDELNEVRLQQLDPEGLEGEARGTGLRPVARHEVPVTDAHVGSTVVVLEKEA